MGWLMAYENYTIKTQEALQDASSIALKNDCPEIGVAHVLMALLQQQDGIVPPLVERIGVSCSDLQNSINQLIQSLPKVQGSAQVYFSSNMQKVLAKAEKEMSNLKDQYLSTEHLLLAISECDDKANDILKSKGLTIEDYDKAKDILLRENYFFLNGYRHLFMKSNVDKRFIDGTTFEENAIIKAEYYYNIYKIPVICDDSGLVVEALNGDPGVHSARYAGEHDFEANIDKVLKNLEGVKNRKAYFQTTAVYYDGKNKLISDGYVHGEILDKRYSYTSPRMSVSLI